MADADETLLIDLAARIAAGETILSAELSEAFLARPEVQRLLRFARVARAFADNSGGTPTEPVAPDCIGPWKLLRLLGSGGMGEVWLGERADGTVEHQVAIKRVRGASPAFAQRLEAERRILARLSHPNIAHFIDAGVDATGAPWLALEYVEGVDIVQWCDQRQPSLRQRLQMFVRLCAAVSHAHRHLVIHRDLKPGNVLVDAQDQPRLLDFGIAKLLDGGSGEVTTAALTPAYAAPEQLRGGVVSTATDVYALGLLLHRLLAGSLPQTRRHASIGAVLAGLHAEETQQPSQSDAAAAAGLPYPLAQLRGDLDAIVSKALRARPEARYGSVQEFAADIQRHLELRPVEARPPTRWYLASRFANRHRGALNVAMAAILGVLLSLALALWQAQRAERAVRSTTRGCAGGQRSGAGAARAGRCAIPGFGVSPDRSVPTRCPRQDHTGAGF